MGWFWKGRKKFSPELEAIQQLREQNSKLEEQYRAMGEQITKLSRLQYKTGNDIQDKLTLVSESIDSIIKKQEAYAEDMQTRMIRTEAKLEEGAKSLIRWLDDLDLVNSRLVGDDQEAWKKLLDQWIEQILELLKKMEVQELQVLGHSFDPRLSESIGTISKAEAGEIYKQSAAAQDNIPYQIVEVVKRGFIWKNDKLLRKAQVITLEEENSNAE